MATFSVSTSPSISSAGTLPLGLRALNSADLCSPRMKRTRRVSNSTPASSSAIAVTRAHV
jgi:hypothetical protein